MKKAIQLTLQTIILSGLINYLKTKLNADFVDVLIVMGAILVWFIIFAIFKVEEE